MKQVRFLSSVDLFFANVDPTQKVTVQVRTVELGTPTLNLAAPHAEVTLEGSSNNYIYRWNSCNKSYIPISSIS
ncbi:MAG: hypothetical protein CM15mV14_0990 [uncultured marine virus]|nr:MAG: hypothetical protein CM15mV14_0990 [uncultured marine virus]